MKGTTESGFKFSIDERALNNMELIEAIAAADKNASNLPKALNLLLGEKQKLALYEHVREKDGIVPSDKVQEEIIDIFHKVGEKEKN